MLEQENVESPRILRNYSIPRLIVLAGPPCSGKSTLAALFARNFGATYLAVDSIRSTILPGAGNRPEHGVRLIVRCISVPPCS